MYLTMLFQEDFINGTLERVSPEIGLEKCYNGTYSCISQTESLDDWLGPWVSFLWLVFLIASIFSVRMIYKTYVKFRDTIARRTGKTYEFKEDVAYETENALGCWNISEKPVEKRIKILYRIYVIPLLIAWLDLFLDIGYVSSFTTNSTRMVSPYIDVRPAIFVIMGIFDIIGSLRILLCGILLWKFCEKLDAPEAKVLARIEVHMEVVVIAFAFIMEDFAELFVEYFCVEKYLTGYEYELDYAQSYMAAVSSITLNMIAVLSFFAFVVNFRKQQKYQTNAMNSLSLVVPLFELVLSSLRTYRFLFQAFFWKKFRPGCVWLAAVEQDAETGELQYKAFQETFSKECFRPLDWIMVILMCIYVIVLIIFIVVYVVKIRPQYQLELSEMTPDNLLGDYKKLPHELNKYIVKPIVKPVTKILPKGSKRKSGTESGSKAENENLANHDEKNKETTLTEIPEYI